MIVTLAWKNMLRSKCRSFVVIGAITVGVWALIFLFSFMNSFSEAYRRNSVNYEYSHIQVHHPDYLIEPDIDKVVSQLSQLEAYLEERGILRSISKRQIVSGMIGSAKTTSGVRIYGIDPDSEGATTSLKTHLLEGNYFNKLKRNPILLSREVADKLNLKIKSKVVLTFQNIQGDITSAAFRVEGIFNSTSPRINGGVVYVKNEDLSRLIGFRGVNEVALLFDDIKVIEDVKIDLKSKFDLSVSSYRDLAPEFDLLDQQSTISKQVLTSIIMLALLFGIINTMLMAVLERTREIGMLKAIGMQRVRIFLMIIFETVVLSLVGGPIGLVLGYLTVWRTGTTGIDFSAYADSLSQYGYGTMFYPLLEADMYLILMVTVLITALVGAIYPAYKAVSLNPLEAIRKV